MQRYSWRTLPFHRQQHAAPLRAPRRAPFLQLLSTSAVVAVSLHCTASPAAAQEVWTGIFAHAVDTPFTFGTGEGGVDLQLGFRASPVEALHVVGSPSPYVMASINARGDTSFVGAGLSWTIGARRIYVRPGLGIVIHDGPSQRVNRELVHTQLGSRVLFEPELGVGVRVTPRLSIEANWTHISHARLFNSRQNPGLDMIGLRLNLRVR